MRLATIALHQDPSPLPVLSLGDGSWIPLAGLMGRPLPGLEAGLPELASNGQAWARAAATWTGERFRKDAFRFLPPVLQPPSFRDFYAFEQHVKTARARRGLEMVPAWYDLPVFYFSNARALIGDRAPVHPPAQCRELDYELELGIVIGKPGRDISPETAWEHVAGFTVLNDLSARDLQRVEVTVGLGPAKGKDFATAVGPWLVTRDEFLDRIDGERLSLDMCARVNGRERSRGNLSSLHHSIPRLIAQASRDADLFSGDLIGTGTVGTGCILELGPENVGGWLQPGDVVELEIERLGVLRTPVAARPDASGNGING